MRRVVAAFFEPDGDDLVATPLTRGPWDVDAQHGGPPAALLARAVEAELPPEFRLARISLDLLRPVPIGRVSPRVSLHVGRRVARARVALDAGGVEVMTGAAMAQRLAHLDLPPPADGSLAPPEAGNSPPFFTVPWDEGYHTAMAWSFVAGSWIGRGASEVWLTQRVPLVAGEEPSPAQRTMVVADAGNGVSAVVDFSRFSFLNTDLSVHLHRDPAGEWIGMHARTVVQPSGAGLATTVLYDRAGPVGSGAQSLLVAPIHRPNG
jgi:Thioesterase-like superfamily